ncbi:MAG: hypothetical protein HKP61_19995 [Dactylosporangium sp.]|nr:hypothetical protein [Dactylosporangium sp.]NNJ63167.1 hypothetical protein [Dactylosporangium sp.]
MELLSWLDPVAPSPSPALFPSPSPSPFPSVGRAPLLHVDPPWWTLALCGLSVAGLIAAVVGLWWLSRNRRAGGPGTAAG